MIHDPFVGDGKLAYKSMMRLCYISTGNMLSSLSLKRKSSGEAADSNMVRNEKLLLQKLIATFNGKRNPIRAFSAKDLKKATNNYDLHKVIQGDTSYRLFEGTLVDQDRPISVMKFHDNSTFDDVEYCFNNIIFSSQMKHKNILKLIGCCLETELPTLVFQSVKYGTLRGFSFASLLIAPRIKIAMEIANAVAYLHVGFDRPIVFRCIKASNVLLDENYSAKLHDFSLSVSIPEGETHVREEFIKGAYGFIAPEYFATSSFNEMCDVYSFGAFLCELLTGCNVLEFKGNGNDDDLTVLEYAKKSIENNRFGAIVDPIFDEDNSFPGKEEKLQSLGQLMYKCLGKSPEHRPLMVDVAKQLRQMYLSVV